MVRRVAYKDVLATPIISTIANTIPTKELLLRLQKIADTLSGIDQDDASTEDFRALAENLANKKLLANKNVGIRSYACCALTDILRLFAPDAPFEPETLSGIFKLFFAEFAGLWNEENPYYQQQCYILRRIVEVRSVVLIADLPDAEKLVSKMFETMYVLAGKGLPSRLEPLAAEMLSETVSEADTIPRDVVGLILKKLIVPASYPVAALKSNIGNTAFAFSLAVCQANVDKMARYVSQHFSEMLDASVSANDLGNTGKDFKASYAALEKIHSSSIQIWAHLPELLSSVMGLIGDELNSDNEKIRELATTSIGSMLASESSGQSSSTTRFISAHKSAWATWLKKSSDASAGIRAAWASNVVPILSTQTLTTDVLRELCDGLTKCLMDSNEKVRLTACKAIRSLPPSMFMNKLCSEHSLNSVLPLCREKHVDIRNEAIYFLSELYNYYLERDLQGKVIDFGVLGEMEIAKVKTILSSTIPNTILQLNYVNDKLLTATVDIVLFEQLAPFNDDSSIRMSRLCLLYENLDQRSRTTFNAINSRQKKTVEVMLKFVDFAEEYALESSLQAENKENSSESSKARKEKLLVSMERVIKWIVASFPGGIHSYECIERFFLLKNLRLINLLKNTINSQLDYKSVKNSIKEILMKVADEKSIKIDGESTRLSAADMISNLKLLLYRTSFIFYNKTNIGQIMELCMDQESRFHKVSNEIITEISNTSPAGFKSHAKTLATMIVQAKDIENSISLLRTLYRFGKKNSASLPSDEAFLDHLAELAVTGTATQARYAVKILHCYEDVDGQLKHIYDAILPFSTDKTTSAHICAVAQMTRLAYPALASQWNAVSHYVIEEVLRKNLFSMEETMSGEFISDSELQEHEVLNRKLCSFKLLVNKIRSIRESTEAPIVEKTVKLFSAFISNNGEVVKSSEELIPTPPGYRARLRLDAGRSLLKLAQVPVVDATISHDTIWKISRLLRDETLQVRKLTFESLRKYLSKNTISERFLFLVFMLGHEPDEVLKSDAKKWILSQHSKLEAKNNHMLETALARLVFGIANDGIFKQFIDEQETTEVSATKEVEAYIYALNYILVYLDTVAKENNCSLLYYIVSRVKQYRAVSNPDTLDDDSVNLYRVAELAQLMIKELADTKGWTLQTWPGKLNLPSDIYAMITDYDEALSVVSRIYIPDDVQVELRNYLAKPGATRAKRKPVQKLAQARGTKKTKVQRKAKDSEGYASDQESVAVTRPRRASRRATKKVVYEEESEEELDERSDVSDDSDFV
ncbi:hypothetical protein PUMCH_002900 [Australozyma saopauloensis]|uniref:Sister chromatid cohesion protein n=1 Tax=Australozyma saopauloensis TaxID=291208 RepID=A0AAX4HAL4_9ASCO|nr:hypothetical protein PUMCH_002900 [[Candida] saopauloensis]